MSALLLLSWLLIMLCKILWIAATRLRWTWTGLDCLKLRSPRTIWAQNRNHMIEVTIQSCPLCTSGNQISPLFHKGCCGIPLDRIVCGQLSMLYPGQPSLLRCYCSCGPASWSRATYVTSPCAHCWLQARVFSFKLELWSMAAAAQDGRTDGPHKNPIQPSRGCTVLYVRCAESTVGRWGNAVALPVCYSDFFPTLVFGLRASYCCNYFMVC
jgi:hypothetical protein